MLISIFYKKFVGLKDIFLQCTNNFLALNFQEKQVLFRNLINFKNIFNLIFQGKEGGLSSDRNLDVGDKVCLKLCENYFNTQYRTLTVDNFFTTIRLANALLEKGNYNLSVFTVNAYLLYHAP